MSLILQRVLEVFRKGVCETAEFDAHAQILGHGFDELQTRLDNAAAELVMYSLETIGRELQSIEQRAQLAKIDAVVRWKRQLEKEVEDIAAGRFPKSMMSRLHIEGLLADDEEFWPPEPEKWADEYEDYK